MVWHQVYNPFNNAALSTIVAAIPIGTLLYFIAIHPHRDKEGARHLGISAPYAAFYNAWKRQRRKEQAELNRSRRFLRDNAGRTGIHSRSECPSRESFEGDSCADRSMEDSAKMHVAVGPLLQTLLPGLFLERSHHMPR